MKSQECQAIAKEKQPVSHPGNGRKSGGAELTKHKTVKNKKCSCSYNELYFPTASVTDSVQKR